MAFTGHLVSSVVDDEVEYEQEHRYDQWHSESTLAYDGSEWCSDKKEHQACHRQRELLDQLDRVAT